MDEVLKFLATAAAVFVTWFFLAWAVERITEILGRFFPVLKGALFGVPGLMYVALGISVFLAYGAGLDFFEMFQIKFLWPNCGQAISGLIMAGGSEGVHAFLDKWIAEKQLVRDILKRLEGLDEVVTEALETSAGP